MKTLIVEGIAHAKTQISHNGGELNGNIAMFRRMGVIQKNGESAEVPYVSGNSVRGKLRDISAKNTLDMLGEDDNPHKVKLSVFQFLFSGGTLTSGKNTDGDIDAFKKIKETLPHASLFGGAWGNAILQGKMKVNCLLPIAKETAHIIPEKFIVGGEASNLPSVHTYLQLEMFTRRENSKDAPLEKYLQPSLDASDETSQMIYHVETLQAGTPFYLKFVLEDVTDLEFAAFVSAIGSFKSIGVMGGKGAVGMGQLDIGSLEWTEISKVGDAVNIDRDLSAAQVYHRFVAENKDAVIGALNSM